MTGLACVHREPIKKRVTDEAIDWGVSCGSFS